MFFFLSYLENRSDVKKKIGFLRTLPSASEKLEIFNADLDKPSSFDAAIEGCIGVFHLAHPMDYEGEEAEEAVVKRSMEGTLGILKACLNSKTVKRVIYTSSAAAVALNNKGLDVMDENAWSDIECCRAFSINSSYAVSKTVTERAALEFAEEHGLDLVTLCPSLVVGPFICPNFPISVRMGLSLIFGTLSLSLSLPFN
uniref:NAD-dependent epimerase/dehydratase domain-containing protein n=1 Tax=Nelumbo nucifera TaxID=4432 RepID=A0A822XI26_NELNU|nr:TPA_asm: hypothetical protein HUJ06_020162 [Nelumbo nucifera]